MSRLLCVVLALCAPLLWFGCSPPGAGDDGPSQPDGGGARPDAGEVGAPDATPEPTSCLVPFALYGHETASTVLLTGSFAGWAATTGEGAIEMASDGAAWTVEHELLPGRHTYKFIVDGSTWVHDGQNPLVEEDGFGGFNSAYVCGSVTAQCGSTDAFDWRDAVMYFAMADRFYDSDGRSDPVSDASGGDAYYGSSGQYEGGDLSGVREKLGYLDGLGVTAIWLSAPFENRDTAGAPNT